MVVTISTSVWLRPSAETLRPVAKSVSSPPAEQVVSPAPRTRARTRSKDEPEEEEEEEEAATVQEESSNSKKIPDLRIWTFSSSHQFCIFFLSRSRTNDAVFLLG